MPRCMMLACGLFGLLTSAAWGQGDPAGDIGMGKELAQKLCSFCHMVGSEEQEGAHHSDAPSFKSMAEGQKTDTESFRAFFNTTQTNVSHTGAMPNPHLRNDEIDKISAYIRSLGTQ
jgi:mono/diheme cytochrome c family protein